jgi:uncharacterized membrane protein YeiH
LCISPAAALAALPALKLLSLAANALTGTLPASWDGADELTLLLLGENAFSGEIISHARTPDMQLASQR